MRLSNQTESADVTTQGRRTSLAKSYVTEYPENSRINPDKLADHHIPGMENVVVTVSGYDSLTRSKLINLIVYVGASNTGSLTRGNTHVVCWTFKGRKYELAKKLGKKIVSHRWFEDCLKAGVLLPEAPYINTSGVEEAPFCWDDNVVHIPHSKALKKWDTTIVLTESVSRPESSSGCDTVPTRGHGVSAFHGRSSDVDHLDTGSSLPTLSKRAISSKPMSLRIGMEQPLSSGIAHISRTGKPDKCSQTAQELAEGRSKRAGLNANQAPVDLRTRKAVGGSAAILSPLTDQSNEARHQSGAYVSGLYPAEVGQQARQSCFPHVEHHAPGYQDYKADYAQLRSKRRREVETPSGSLREKYRGLTKDSPSLMSGKLAYGEEKGGSTCRAFMARYLGSPSSQNSVRKTASVQVDNQRDSSLRGEIDDTALTATGAIVSASPSKDIACVICHTETKPTREGLLECGHRYCYPCIQKWADEATSKQSTCPLCKASFEFITIRELERSTNDENCTQVLEERVVMVGRQIRQGQKINLSCPRSEAICVTCESKDSPELLMTCSRCCQRSCHTFCLDPPLLPGSSWFCSRCSPVGSRYLSRESVMSRFCT